jgi:hypothetical protein
MTAEAVGNSPTSKVTPISAGRRLRVLRSLHARLIRFPQQDEVLATLLARWPSLFADGTVIAHAEPSHHLTDLDIGRATQDDAAHCVALVGELDDAHHEIAGLRVAVESNRQIGIAIGVLMSQRHLTSEQAFDLLRESQPGQPPQTA